MHTQDLRLGFPVPPLIRFVGREEALISNTNGGPRIFLNIEDHQSYQTGVANRRFDVRTSKLSTTFHDLIGRPAKIVAKPITSAPVCTGS